MEKNCKHDMPIAWCAECNGDAKKLEQDERTEFSGLQSLVKKKDD